MELKSKDLVVIRGIAELSRRYEDEILALWTERREEYETDWFAAFDFFLAHVFFQGRRDTLSERYYKSATAALASVLSGDPKARAKGFDEAWRKRWIPQDRNCSGIEIEGNTVLNGLIGHGVGKRRDRLMVLDALRYIRSLDNWNIVVHSLDQIRAGNLRKHYEELQQIVQVGPKTAAFYLRDLCTLFGVDLEGDDWLVTQPIDTWVRRIAEHLGVTGPGEQDDVVRDRIVEACAIAGVSSSKFNAGAWYLGTHSFALALEGMERRAVESAV